MTAEQFPNFPMKRCPFSPPPQYAELREDTPVSKVTLPGGDWAWLVTRYDDVRAVLGDNRFSTQPATPGYPFIAPARAALLKNETPPPFIRMDPPEHGKYRRMLTKEFMVKHVEAMRPAIVTLVDGLLDEMIRKGSPADFFEDFALQVPTTVISKILGVPREDEPFFQDRSKAKLDLAADPTVPVRAAADMREYLDRLIRDKEAHRDSNDDLITRLLTDQVLPGHMSREELRAMVELLIIGGHETTANTIALGTLSLLEHPEQKDALVADPTLANTAVEEILRFHTPVHYNGARAALEDITIGGQLIRKGEGVLAMINSANRDSAVFDDPDTFDIRRQSLRHLAFSYGVHQCIGQPLARAELQTVFGTLFRRLPKLALSIPLSEVPFRYDAFVFGVDAMPVTW
jgi:cytochrome P450